MGVASFPDQGSPRAARSAGFQFAVRLAAPVGFLVLLWIAAAAAALGGALDQLPGFRTASPHDRALYESSVVAGAGLVVVLVAVLLAWAFTRRLAREMTGLAATAGRLAEEQLPQVVQRLRDGELGGPAGPAGQGDPAGPAHPAAEQAEIAPWPAGASAESAAAAAALVRMQRAAIAAAVAEAGVRNGLRQILASLGKRNQALLHRQLRIIDNLEQQAESPVSLAELFTLDHLTTRMRRHAESLSMLSGAAPARSWSGPVPVIDVLRAAVSEVEDYKRVTVLTDTEEAVAPTVVTDMIHLLAELVENATLFSPSTTRVEVRAERVANGFAIEVEDRGLGIAPAQLAEINEQLANPPDFDMADADRLGLFVTGRLAARHGVQVSLAPSPYRGTKAVVMLPDSIMITAGAAQAALAASAAGGRGLGLQTPEALSLVGAVHARSLSTLDAADETARLPGRHALGDDSGDTFHGLPRRVRPGSPAQPRGGQHAAANTDEKAEVHAPPEAPAPEHARNLISSLQDSWQRSREADDLPESAASQPSGEWLDDTGEQGTNQDGRASDD
jgi:signal transduction histidine kinase